MGIDTSIFESAVSDHMDSQPYEITCTTCGSKLDCSSTVDNDHDLKLYVEPCKDCLEEQFDLGQKS